MRPLTDWIPSLSWLPRYKRADLPGDLSAGITTAVMLIPQGMAYAMLAGLPPIVGLYASTLPLAVYALLGTSRQLAVGPVAMVSLMVASSVGAMAEGGSAEFLALAVLLAGMVGVIQLAMGVFRLGFLVNFLSHPVISGFTSAAALIIGLSQLKHLLGVDIPRSHHVHEILLSALSLAGDIDPLTFGIGLGGIALLVGLKRWRPAFPRALAVVVVSTLAVLLLGLDEAGVGIVGDVPAGLPAFALPEVTGERLSALLPTALLISFIGFMESISVAKALATRNRYTVDADQELIALGAANIAGTMFGGYPVTGGFSRTAVNDQAGARTPLASLITAAMVGLTLLFFTPLFHDLPKATLAAIVMSAVFGLIDVKTFRHLLEIRKTDAAMMALTFFATLALGIELGIAAGVGVSLLLFLRRTMRPHTAVLAEVPGSGGRYRNIARNESLECCEGIAILRFDAAIYFANVAWLRQQVEALREETDADLLILDCSAVNDIDASGVEALDALAQDLQRSGTTLRLARVKGPVMDTIRRSHLPHTLGPDGFADSVHAAVTGQEPAEPPSDPGRLAG